MLFTIPIVIAVLIALIACLLVLQPETLSKTSLQDKIMRNEFKSSRHKWQRSQQKSFYFCYLCGKLTNGWFSDVLECKKCGIIIHKICRYTKLRKPDCKYLVAKNNATRFYHQWRQCNYTANTSCSICTQICSGLENYICLWCNRMRHGLCSGEGIECDFGPLRQFILEPTEIKCSSINFTTNAFKSLKRMQHAMRDKTSGSEDNDSDEQNKIAITCDAKKHVVVVLINKKSGGQVGNNFIKTFYRILNPLQVISILDEGLEKLKLFADLPNLFLLIAGGDGTVCSVMNYVKTVPQWAKQNPPAAILPLGTGNDLSRALGWGGSIQEVNASELLQQYFGMGKQEQLDRWRLTVGGEENRQFTVYNYIGIGLDAKICKDFHDIREKYPQLFFSQFSNKLIYTQIGTIDLFKNSSLRLSRFFTMTIDDVPVSIEEYENIILLNIDNWGGGVTGLWKADSQRNFRKQSFSDGVIEVIGLTDVLHMGQVQIGMDEPFQIGQGKVIRLTSCSDNQIIPLQIDGEPLEFITPFEIVIERKDQINVLATTPTDSGKINHFLRLALQEQVINEQQLGELLALSKRCEGH